MNGIDYLTNAVPNQNLSDDIMKQMSHMKLIDWQDNNNNNNWIILFLNQYHFSWNGWKVTLKTISNIKICFVSFTTGLKIIQWNMILN